MGKATLGIATPLALPGRVPDPQSRWERPLWGLRLLLLPRNLRVRVRSRWERPLWVLRLSTSPCCCAGAARRDGKGHFGYCDSCKTPRSPTTARQTVAMGKATLGIATAKVND